MSRISHIFASCRSEGRAALMPFVTGGFPSIEATQAVLAELERAGASIVEIGIPFSDPIADGPVIASSMHRALESGVTPEVIFRVVSAVREPLSIGLIAMVSQSIVHRMGASCFCDAAARAGFDGLIIPDIDLAEADSLARECESRWLSLSMLIAPTTSPQRMREIVHVCSGFVYLLARVGITGERGSVDHELLADRIAQVRSIRDIPVAVGFGISTVEHVRAVAALADGVIVGSAIVRRTGEASDPVAAAGEFVGQLHGGLCRG